MLSAMNACRQADFIVISLDENFALSQHRTGVDIFDHFMHGASGMADPGGKRLADGVHAAKCRQQTWMNVE